MAGAACWSTVDDVSDTTSRRCFGSSRRTSWRSRDRRHVRAAATGGIADRGGRELVLDLSLLVESLMAVQMASRVRCADRAGQRRGRDGQGRDLHGRLAPPRTDVSKERPRAPSPKETEADRCRKDRLGRYPTRPHGKNDAGGGGWDQILDVSGQWERTKGMSRTDVVLRCSAFLGGLRRDRQRQKERSLRTRQRKK